MVVTSRVSQVSVFVSSCWCVFISVSVCGRERKRERGSSEVYSVTAFDACLGHVEYLWLYFFHH